MSGLTAIVPCYNEGAQVDVAYRGICAALGSIENLELLFVDDGSTDDTLARIRTLAAADARVRYLSFARNFGLPAAVTAGFRYAAQPWCVQLDADLQFPPQETWRLLERAAQGYDVVFGIRRDRRDPWLRRVGAAGTHVLARRLLGIEVPQGATSFRVVRTAVGVTIVNLPTGNSHFVAKAPELGARHTTVEVEHVARDGRSRFRLGRLAGDAFELLFGFSWRPLNAMYLMACLTASAALVLAVLGASGVLSSTGLQAAGLLSSAVTVLAVATTARYLHRRMLDVRPRRPYYVREANLPVAPEDLLDGGRSAPPPPRARRAGALVVLGAGEEQVAIYRDARARGLSTIAVDRRADRPAIPLADEFLQISTTDHEAIAMALAGREIAGVVTTAADTGLASWHALTVHFDTPWRYPAAAVAVSMDKSALHRLVSSLGMPTYAWRQSDDLDELAAAARTFRFPLVVKPTDASGGRGVRGVHSAEQLDSALRFAAAHSPRGQVIVEEFVSGRDLTVNVFMVDGAVALAAVTDKRVLPGPGFLVAGHVAPAELDPVLHRALLDDAERVCTAFGLTDGPANFDVVVADDGTRWVIEVGARMSGNGFPQLARASTSADWVHALVGLAIGEPVRSRQLSPRPARLHVLTSPLEQPGRLRAVTGLDAAAALPGVASVEVFCAPGEVVHPYTEAGRKLGWIVVTADDRAGLDEVLDEALRTIRIGVDPLAVEVAHAERTLVPSLAEPKV